MENKDLGSETEDELREACGVFGCVASGEWPTNLDVAQIIYLGLHSLQHRGQESCGISTSFGEKDQVQTIKRDGLVGQAFKNEDLATLKGNLGIGHTRYSTTGGTTNPLNIQPFDVYTKHGMLCLAHNGELVNAPKLRRELLEQGIGLATKTDSELMVQILCKPPYNETDGADWPTRIRNMMKHAQLSYSLLIMCGDVIYAVRDPFGNRPLCLGKVAPSHGSLISEMLQVNAPSNGMNGHASDLDEDMKGYVVASESCALPSFGGKFIREVLPGEIVEISRHGFKSICIVPRPDQKPPAFCIFEYVYFARADSLIEGQMVYLARKECGRQLARQAPVEADIVSCVPESSMPAALGYAEESKIPYADVLCKSRYVGRTFIQPTKHLRQLATLKKFGPLSETFKGKRIVLIDDSIVRGTTIGVIISLLREAGAAEIHLRIASPPLRNPCYMGINIPTREELIANKLSEDQLAKKIGVNSLVHLTVDNLSYAARKNAYTNGTPLGHCTACLTGEYPVELEW